MVLVRALQWERRLTNRRGVVFLLSVYFASLLLLILSGIAIQRTMIETRAGQFSRDNTQAFYLADGALDYALSAIKKYNLLDGVCYAAFSGTADGSPATCDEKPNVAETFTLQTLSGEVASNATQRLVRKVIATAQSGPAGKASVSGYVEETGPLQGLWGKGVVDVHGGITALPQFVKGSMRSNVGVLTSDAKSGLLDLDGAAYADSASELDADMISDELRSVKNGYKCLELGKCVGSLDITLQAFEAIFPELLATNTTVASLYYDFYWSVNTIYTIAKMFDQLPSQAEMGSTYGENHADMRFNQPTPLPKPFQETIPAASGAYTMGAIQSINTISGGSCTANLVLKAGSITKIDKDTDPSTIPGLMAVQDDLIWMCVNSITPDTDEVWFDTLTDSPPTLVFDRPAIIVVTGTKYFDVEDSNQLVYSKQYGYSVPVQTAFPYAGVQYDWYVAIAAKIEAPKGLYLLLPENTQSLPANRTPVVWLKPGKEFDVAVHAPSALVVVRQRTSGTGPPPLNGYYGDKLYKNGEIVPYKFRSIVGNEVIVELNDDAIEVGTSKKDQSKCTTKFLGWGDGA